MEERPLWAPWRIEYIVGPKPDECIFCASPSRGGEAPDRPLERGSRCFTMLNAFPYTSGHVMVAPYRHVAALEDLDDGEVAELMGLARRTVAALRALMAPDGFNIGLNLGKVAGAGFADHLHLHVVPRWDGDVNFMPVIGGTRVIPQALEATRGALADALDRVP